MNKETKGDGSLESRDAAPLKSLYPLLGITAVGRLNAEIKTFMTNHKSVFVGLLHSFISAP